MWAEVGFVLGCYLYGSIPFIWWGARKRGVNLREHGSISGSILWRTSGIRPVIIYGAGDFSKGVFPILIGYYVIDFSLWVVGLGGMLALIGQMWPVFLGFSGGKGGAAGIGLSVTLTPVVAIISFVPFIGAGIWRHTKVHRGEEKEKKDRSAALGMLTTFTFLPFIAFASGSDPEVVYTYISLPILILTRRATFRLKEDIQGKNRQEIFTILKNRLLYDHS
jgi:glycerol-3-phosphate acyltransferase PlsY